MWGPEFTVEEMMMQVLFLSKVFLTADDALTTNQQNERIDNMLILILEQHLWFTAVNRCSLHFTQKTSWISFCFWFKSHETYHFNTCQLSPQFRKTLQSALSAVQPVYFTLMRLTLPKVLTNAQNKIHYYI